MNNSHALDLKHIESQDSQCKAWITACAPVSVWLMSPKSTCRRSVRENRPTSGRVDRCNEAPRPRTYKYETTIGAEQKGQAGVFGI